MAFIQSYEDDKGNTYSNAYHRVVEINCNFDTETAHLVMFVYKSKSARLASRRPVGFYSWDFFQSVQVDEAGVILMPLFSTVFSTAILDKSNPVKASYTWIRSLPLFSSAIDDPD